MKISRELIHAIGDDDKAHREIERLLDELKGGLIFEPSEGIYHLSMRYGLYIISALE